MTFSCSAPMLPIRRGGKEQVAVLFISHSSRDDACATALEAWLNANGFTDIFVDHHSIAGGDKWRVRTLLRWRSKLRRARARKS